MRDYTFLESRGWRVIVVWECKLAKADFRNTVSEIQRQLDINRESWLEEMAAIKQAQEEAKRVTLRKFIDKFRLDIKSGNRLTDKGTVYSPGTINAIN